MSSNLVVALVGMPGSGKSVVADRFVEKGFHFIRFGQIAVDIIKERGLPLNEENENAVRIQVREKHGMGGYALLNIPKIDEALKNSNVVIDNLLSWSEYKIMKNKYGDQCITVAIHASPEIRYKRLSERTEIDEKMRNRPLSYEDAKKRDYREIENVEKGGPIAMAEYVIINEGGIEELRERISNLFEKLGIG